MLAAYKRLTQCDLILFLSLRGLPTQGSASELVRRLVKHDLKLYRGQEIVEDKQPSGQVEGDCAQQRTYEGIESAPKCLVPAKNGSRGSMEQPLTKISQQEVDKEVKGSLQTEESTKLPRIRAVDKMPLELWSEIFEHLGNWQIATALQIPTRLKRPWDWVNATDLDVAILTGNLHEVKAVVDKDNPNEPLKFTDAGADVMVKWGYVDLLDHFFKHSYRNFLEVFQKDKVPPNEVAIRMEIPWLASRYGQTKVLDWWLANSSPNAVPTHVLPLPTPNSLPLPPLYRKYDEGALNQASWQGHINVLQWWKDSGLPLRIGDVMDWATVGGHISVLEWWKHSGENTNIMHRDALCIASTRGKIEFLEWFRNSGLQLTYGNDILAIITKKNKPESLEWWAKSGLRIEYAISDIWEAIEDATTKGDEARDWWLARGVKFDGLDSEEWTRLRVL
ncbi:hypothetical protein BDZ91DRAFT_449768 [Kalaharituber pfeilii]|nr:hypothetical protein BDZ91DRAFT_449768 [Kalaharituber pfeilii]